MESGSLGHFWRPDKTLIRSELNNYFSSGFLTDLRVICGKKVFNVHKLVLAAASEYILDMFNQEDDIDQIYINDYDEKDVEAFVYDLYEMPNLPDSKQRYLDILDLLKIENKELNQIELHNYLGTSVKQEVNGNYFDFEDHMGDSIDNVFEEKLCIKKEKSKRPKSKATGEETKDIDSNGTKVYREKSRKLIGIKTFNQDDEMEEAINGFEYKYKENEKTKKCNKRGRPRKDTEKGLTSKMIRERNRAKNRLKRQVTCLECGEVTKNKTDLLEHHKIFHKVKKPNPREKFTCPTCGKSVPWRHFEYHVAKHDPDADLTKFEKFECDKCGKKFQFGHLKKKHVCERVSSYFRDNDERIICTLCLHVFSDLKEVLPHKQDKHIKAYELNLNKSKVPIFECPVEDCFDKFNNVFNVKSHLQHRHFSVKKVKCIECEERFCNSNVMKKHRQEVHGLGADLQCENCGEKFFSQSKLEQHIYQKHTNERHHLCPHCPRRFKMKNTLKRHLFCHDMNVSKFECDLCGKKFRDKATLGYHTNTHTGEKPFKCQNCPYAAASLPVLHLHRIKCSNMSSFS